MGAEIFQFAYTPERMARLHSLRTLKYMEISALVRRRGRVSEFDALGQEGQTTVALAAGRYHLIPPPRRHDPLAAFISLGADQQQVIRIARGWE